MASREGKARGFIAISMVGSALIDRMGFSGEFEALDKILYRDDFRAGVLKGNTELLAFVNKGLNAISQEELAAIEARWIPDPAKRFFRNTSPFIRLTPEEEAWIKNNDTIRVGISPIFPPLKFAENGVIKGIELDYLDLLSQYTGIRFEYVVGDLQHMDAMLKSGEIDMFLSSYIPERLASMIFTEPLIEFKEVIVARRDFPFMFGVSALQGKRVATVKGEKLYDKILAPYPEIEALPMDTLEDMFRAVEASKADVLITKSYLAGYSINKYPNLKIAGDAGLPSEPYMYAVRKDYPKLVSILNKAFGAMPQERRETIVQKWFSIRIDYHPDFSEILKWASAIVGAFLLILGITLFWNRRLTREIDNRRQAEKALRESEERYRKILENVLIGIYQVTFDGKFLFVNQKMTEMFGYASSEELIAIGSVAELYARPEERHKVVNEIIRLKFLF